MVAGTTMKILMLSYEFPPIGGGGGRVVEGLIRQLIDDGHAVDLVTMRWSAAATIARDPNLTVHKVPCLRFRPDRCGVFELATYVLSGLYVTRRLLRRRRFDAHHAHFILPDGLILYLLRLAGGPRFLITAHGSDVPDYNPDRFRVLHRVLAPVWRRVIAAADRIVCPSPSLEQLIKDRLPDARTMIIANGFAPSRLAGAKHRERSVLVLSRLQPRKGVHLVVQAFSTIDTDYELHIAGDGPMLSTITRLAANDPRIVVHGWLDGDGPQLIELLQTSSIFVLFSKAENFPVSLLEAMASGLAIITTRGTGCADVVGDAALLVEPGDLDGLRAALQRLLDEPELVARLALAGRQRLVENFCWDQIGQRYVRLYAERDVRAAGEKRLDIEGAGTKPLQTKPAPAREEPRGARW
jgi:glycosyltransferase involved in cell wall biosynthesis